MTDPRYIRESDIEHVIASEDVATMNGRFVTKWNYVTACGRTLARSAEIHHASMTPQMPVCAACLREVEKPA